MKKHLSLAHSSLLFCILFIATATQAQTVLTSKRIGGFAEDIEFVSSGPLKHHIIMVNGYEVLGVDKFGHQNQPLLKLFDLRCLGINIRPNGIAYIESEDLFIVNDDTQHNKLFLVDQYGRPQGTRTIQHLNGYEPEHVEGLAYIPASSPNFPDHLMQVAYDDLGSGPKRIEILKRDGQVVAEIFRSDWPLSFNESGIGDVAYLGPNRLLFTLYDETNTVWTLDFAGNIISGPVAVPGGGSEGIVVMKNNRIVVAGFPQQLLFLDKNLNRLTNLDRNDIVGLNVNLPRGVAWNSTTNRHLVTYQAGVAFNSQVISEIPTSLDSVTQIVDLAPGNFFRQRHLSYLPGENLIALAHRNLPRAILLFKPNGTLDSQLDLASLGFGLPFAVEYISTTNQFAVVFNNPNDATEFRKIRILSRTGALVRTIDLSCTGTSIAGALAFFNPTHPSGGQFLIIGSNNRILVTDFNGNRLSEFNSRVRLGMITPVDVTAITTGPQAGAFAMVDSGAGEIVVFRLD